MSLGIYYSYHYSKEEFKSLCDLVMCNMYRYIEMPQYSENITILYSLSVYQYFYQFSLAM